MSGIKNTINAYLWKIFFHPQSSVFPNAPDKIFIPIKEALIRWKSKTAPSPTYQFGQLLPVPDPAVARLFAIASIDNQNALGNWSNKKDQSSAVHLFEYDIVRYLSSLYRVSPDTMGGYVTTGGTEGNLMSSWMGMSYLSKHGCGSNTCLLRTSLTHYSIKKASRIIRVPDVVVGLDNNWGMSSKSLSTTIHNLYKNGKRGFLIPLTIGYTQTGTSDAINQIVHTITLLKRKLPQLYCFMWIDAALNGLTTPFITSDFFPFKSTMIEAVVVDFHKFGGAPYNSGVILYKKRLQKLIQSSINYLPEIDATLIGSRAGASIVAIWSAIHLFGKKGFIKRALTQTKNKDLFITLVKKLSNKIILLDESGSVTCGIIFSDLPYQKLPKNIEDKYGLFSKPALYTFINGVSKYRIYKFHFLPHCRREDVLDLFSDIQGVYATRRL